MDMPFNIKDWYWLVGNDTTKAWSSREKSYVTEWQENRVTKIISEAELNEVFYNAGLWQLAPNPTPQTIQAWKGKCVLADMGYYDAVVAYTETSAAQSEHIAFDNAPEWSRTSIFIREMATMLNLSDEQVDQMFRTADAVTI